METTLPLEYIRTDAGTQTVRLSEIVIPAGVVINESYVREFEAAYRDKSGRSVYDLVSVEALFADITYLHSKADVDIIFKKMAVRKILCGIDQIPGQNRWVWHTYYKGDHVCKKEIAKEFDNHISKSEGEILVENAECLRLEKLGVSFQRQVHCAFGVADIVTDAELIEVKDRITSKSYREALGQLLMYAVSFPGRRLVIAGRPTAETPTLRGIHSFITIRGVSL